MRKLISKLGVIGTLLLISLSAQAAYEAPSWITAKGFGASTLPPGIPQWSVVWAAGGSTVDPLSDTPEDVYGTSGYLQDANGIYTHYVDQSDPNCVANIDGTESVPSCDIANSYPAGSIVHVYGGGYDVGTDRDETMLLAGTASQPIFLLFYENSGWWGFTSNASTNHRYTGSWAIIRGEYAIRSRAIVGDNGVNDKYLVYMDSEIAWGTNGGINISGLRNLAYNNYVHHRIGDDRHCINLSRESLEVGVLANDLRRCAGNGIQFTDKADPATGPTPTIIWVGDNFSDQNGETALGTKYSDGFIISRNVFIRSIARQARTTITAVDAVENQALYNQFGIPTSWTNTSGGSGYCLVLGADGEGVDGFITNNFCEDNEGPGIRIERTTPAYASNNLLLNNGGSAFKGEKTQNWKVCHNTLVCAVGSGSQCFEASQTPSPRYLPLADNIIYNVAKTYVFQFGDGDPANNSDIEYNLMWDTSGTFDYQWRQFSGTQTLSADCTVDPATCESDLNSLPQSGTGSITGNKVRDPLFTSVAGKDFTLGGSSPAIDAADSGCMDEIEAAYQAKFAGHFPTTILVDLYGGAFPADPADYDMGAVQEETDPPSVVDQPPYCPITSSNVSSRTFLEGNASFTIPLNCIDDITAAASLVYSSFSASPGASTAGNWSLNTGTTPPQIEYSGTTIAENVTFNWNLSDGVNSAVPITLNIFITSNVTPTAPVPIVPIADTSNIVGDTNFCKEISFEPQVGHPLTSATWGNTPDNFKQDLTLNVNKDCNGVTQPDMVAATGTLPVASEGGGTTPYPWTVLVNTNAASGSVAFAGTGCVVGFFGDRSASAASLSAPLINSIAGTEAHASTSIDGGAAVNFLTAYWDSVAAGTRSWSVTGTTNPMTIILESPESCSALGTVPTPITQTGWTNGSTKSITLTGETDSTALIALYQAKGSPDTTPATTIDVSDLKVATMDSTQRSIEVWVDNLVSGTPLTYTVTSANGATMDSIGLVVIPIQAGSAAVVGADVNSPHGAEICGVNDIGTSSPCGGFTAFVAASGVNQPPVAVDDFLDYEPNSVNTYLSSDSVLINDIDPDVGDSIFFDGIVAQPPASQGTVTITSGGIPTLTPVNGYYGNISLTYRIRDNSGATDTAVLTFVPTPAPEITYNNGVDFVINQTEETAFTPIQLTGNNISSWFKASGFFYDPEDLCSLITVSATGLVSLTSGLVPTFTGVDDSYTCILAGFQSPSGRIDSIRMTLNSLDDGVGSPVSPTFPQGATRTFGVNENQTGVGTVNVNDIDDINSVSLCPTSEYADNALIQVGTITDNGGGNFTGPITFLSAPDREARSGFQFCLSGLGDGISVRQIWNVTLNNVVETPESVNTPIGRVQVGAKKISPAMRCSGELTATFEQIDPGACPAISINSTNGAISLTNPAEKDLECSYQWRCKSTAGNGTTRTLGIISEEQTLCFKRVSCMNVESVDGGLYDNATN